MQDHSKALRVAVVGLGQAGGNLAAEFARRGYPALALNTATTDLAALGTQGRHPSLPAERRLYIGQDGYDGAGADPEYGRACIRQEAETIRAKLLELSEDADVLILTAGLGGGTGSALGALIELLDDDLPPSLAMLTLPTHAESGLTKVNAIRSLSGLLDASLDGWILVDNARLAEASPELSLADFYPEINARACAPLDALNQLNSREQLTAIRAFDGEDLRRLLLSGGLLSYAQVETEALSAQAVFAAIADGLIEGGISPPGFQMNQLTHLAVVIEAPEEVLAASSVAAFEQLREALKEETSGGTVTLGVYSSRQSGPVRMHLLAAARGIPARVEQLLSQAQSEGRQLSEKEQTAIPGLALGELSDLALSTPRRTGRRTQRGAASPDPAPDKPRASLSERLPTSPGSPRPPSRRGNLRRPIATGSRDLPEVQADPAPDHDTSAAEMTMHAQGLAGLVGGPRPGPASQEADTGELPSPSFYEQLVTDYRAGDEAARARIARRLEDDAASDSGAIRFYAVEAMIQINPKAFTEALFAAASDADEAVRALAHQAVTP